MSARRLDATWWAVQFAYPGKTAVHWKEVLVMEATEREANREAEQLYCRDGETAVDFLVTPMEEGGAHA